MGVGGAGRGPREQRYRGPDRRGRGPTGRAPAAVVARAWAQLLVLALLPGAFALTAGPGVARASGTVDLMTALIATACGVAALVTWRMTGLALAGTIGSAFVALGLLLLAQSGTALRTGIPAALLAPYEGVVVALAVQWALMRGLRGPAVDSALAPLEGAVRATLVGVAAFQVLVLTARFGLLPAAMADPRMGRLAAALAAVAWIAGAGVAARGVGRRQGVPTWLAGSLAILAASQLVAVVAPGDEGTLAASVVRLASAALALAGSGCELSTVLRLQDRGDLRLRMDAQQLRRELDGERHALRARLHELRNTVAGLRSADRTLRRYAAQLDDTTRVALVEAMRAELERLQVLIEPSRPVHYVAFDLATAVAELAQVERCRGTNIVVDVPHLEVIADPVALAQVLQNLLVNARRYAPGTTVEITGTDLGRRAELRVRDGGPGVPAADRARIFQRAARGENAVGVQGEGLGLHVAAGLIAASGGTLRLADDGGAGACFVIELPSPRSAPPGSAERRRLAAPA